MPNIISQNMDSLWSVVAAGGGNFSGVIVVARTRGAAGATRSHARLAAAPATAAFARVTATREHTDVKVPIASELGGHFNYLAILTT